jgi:dihydrofolate synthase / folylpolyglutamate synthase
LQTAGYKTGLYTSPHLKDFRERIKVNGLMIQEQSVIDFTERIKDQIEKIEPSFFEITVAMAFEYFAEQNVDIAVIETGLGGRLDSTNIINPELSVITNIGWDHMNMLGDTLEKIAFEKAGIIKPGVPVVIGEVIPETKPVFERVAKERSSPIFYAEEEFTIQGHDLIENTRLSVVIEDSYKVSRLYTLDLPGVYQAKNLITVLSACIQLVEKGFNILQAHIDEGVANAKKITGLYGRWEVIKKSPLVVLDVAHNPDGVAKLLEQLKEIEFKHLHIIIGMVKDKDVDKVLELLPAKASYYFTKANIPRALPEEELKQKALQYKLQGKSYSGVNTAIYAASLSAGKDDLIIVCGSIFLVGEVSINSIKEAFGKENVSLWDSHFLEMLSFFDG